MQMMRVARRWVSAFKLFGRGGCLAAPLQGGAGGACVILAGLRLPAEFGPQVWVTTVAAARRAVMHAVAPLAVVASDCQNTAVDIHPTPSCCGSGPQHGVATLAGRPDSNMATVQHDCSRTHARCTKQHTRYTTEQPGAYAQAGLAAKQEFCQYTSRQQHRVHPRGQGARGWRPSEHALGSDVLAAEHRAATGTAEGVKRPYASMRVNPQTRAVALPPVPARSIAATVLGESTALCLCVETPPTITMLLKTQPLQALLTADPEHRPPAVPLAGCTQSQQGPGTCQHPSPWSMQRKSL